MPGPYRIIAQYMQALLGLLNLAIGSPALATNSAVSAVSASWPLSAMDCTSTVGATCQWYLLERETY